MKGVWRPMLGKMRMGRARRLSVGGAGKRTFIIAGLVLSTVLSGVTEAQSDTITVVLRPECTVTGAMVHLSDVAASVSPRRLLDLELGRAPVPGAFARFSAEFIRTRIEQVVGPGTQVRLFGAEVVRVQRTAQDVPRSQLAEAIRQRVNRDLPEGARAEIELVRAPQTLRLPAGQVVLRAEPLGTVRPGQMAFRVECVVDGTVVRTFAVSAKVRLYQKVLVAMEDIPARKRVTAHAVRVEERPLTRTLGTVLTSPAQAIGKETRVRVRQGTVLTQRLLRQIPLVRRGERVRLVVRLNNVIAETYGRALQEGGPNANVLVRNEGSGRTVQGRVAGPGLVVVAP